MRVALLGAGNAGSKVVDQALARQQNTDRDFITHATVYNSATADFGALDVVPENNRILIGESKTAGHGAGTDNKIGKQIAQDDIHKIKQAIGDIAIHQIDAFIVATSLGGGTGSGAAPVIAEHLKRSYTEPIYGLGILPAQNEGGVYQLNAARSLPALEQNTDNVILFDNEVWRSSGESVAESYDKANAEIVDRFVTLFGAGESAGQAAENVVDSSEIINTLDCGGVSTIGYSTTNIEARSGSGSGGLLSSFTDGDKPTSDRRETKIVGLIRQATTGQLTVPVTVESTTKALCVVSGPQDELSRSGIENSRNWIEERCECLEVRGGDDPREQGHLAGCVLLSGVTECNRIDEFQDQAADAQQSMQQLEQELSEKTADLVDTDGQIDPL